MHIRLCALHVCTGLIGGPGGDGVDENNVGREKMQAGVASGLLGRPCPELAGPGRASRDRRQKRKKKKKKKRIDMTWKYDRKDSSVTTGRGGGEAGFDEILVLHCIVLQMVIYMQEK